MYLRVPQPTADLAAHLQQGAELRKQVRGRCLRIVAVLAFVSVCVLVSPREEGEALTMHLHVLLRILYKEQAGARGSPAVAGRR